MPFSVTWTIGTTNYTRSFSITNAKIRELLKRSALFQNIKVEGRTEQEIALDLMDKDIKRHVMQSEHVQRGQQEAANEAAIDAILAADHTLT